MSKRRQRLCLGRWRVEIEDCSWEWVAAAMRCDGELPKLRKLWLRVRCSEGRYWTQRTQNNIVRICRLWTLMHVQTIEGARNFGNWERWFAHLRGEMKTAIAAWPASERGQTIVCREPDKPVILFAPFRRQACEIQRQLFTHHKFRQSGANCSPVLFVLFVITNNLA